MFRPGFLALWPGKSGEVEVTLRSRGVGKYNALLEAMTLHIKSSCEGESCFLQAFAGKNHGSSRTKTLKNRVFPLGWFHARIAPNYGRAVMSFGTLRRLASILCMRSVWKSSPLCNSRDPDQLVDADSRDVDVF